MFVFLRNFFILSLLCSPLLIAPISVNAEISESQAAKQAKSKHGGKVLSVSKVSSQEGVSTYKVKLLLPGGRVKTVTIRG